MHTHYDNLKVSRDAPPEVIRAAYKSLSQKYHPDRHADSDEANRIMRLLNAAYEVLRDPARRAEHDQWIAAQEKREAEQKQRRAQAQRAAAAAQAQRRATQPPPRPAARPAPQPAPEPEAEPDWDAPPRRRKARRPRPDRQDRNDGPAMPLPRYGSFALYAAVGAVIVILLGDWSGASEATPEHRASQIIKSAQASGATAAPRAAASETGAAARTGKYQRPALTPRGLPWPAHSGYLSGYPVLNDRGLSTLTVDNARSMSDVLVKLVALDGNTPLPVRTSFVRGGSSFTMENISPGSYDIRYQSLDTGEIFRSERFELAQAKENGGTSFGRTILTLQTVPEGKSRSAMISERDFP